MATKDDNRQPLPAGAVIEYSGEQAVVVRDGGGERIEVEVDGFRQRFTFTRSPHCVNPGHEASTDLDVDAETASDVAKLRALYPRAS